jgi:hypothetical protein
MIEARIVGISLVCGTIIGWLIRAPQLATAKSRSALLEEQLSRGRGGGVILSDTL